MQKKPLKYYDVSKGKRIIFDCQCSVDNEKCKVNDNLNGSCKDSFVIMRDKIGNITPEQCLKRNLKNKSICKYAVIKENNG